MTKQDFINYLSRPEELNGNSLGALEKLVQEYPYFQLGRMLYLKNLHNENSIAYEKNLHITSAYAPSGKVLYNLIKRRPVEKAVREESIGEVKNKKEEIEQPLVIQEQPKEILPALEPVTVLQEMPVNTQEHTPAAENVKKDDELDPDSYRDLEKEMLREAYRTSMSVDLLEGTKDKGQKVKDEKTAPVLRPHLPTSESYSFGDWMKVVSGKTTEVSKEEKAQQRKAKTSIIDDFILDQAAKTPPKPKVEFYSAENMAKKSLQDDEKFVSETLARIYLKQGNLPKALRSYEILLVKYPEKLHIFAPLLEKIKKLIKDQNAK